EVVDRKEVFARNIKTQALYAETLNDRTGQGIAELQVFHAKIGCAAHPEIRVLMIMVFAKGVSRKFRIGCFRGPSLFLVFIGRAACQKGKDGTAAEVTVTFT